ncbi:MAG: phage holin family protein [Clostridia bacterium]|nr:phage holin family protein [Clostridia bacterium]
MFGFAGVASITAICYLIAECVKTMTLDNKFIPPICGAMGGVLGILALRLAIPEFPATDYISALAVGIVSGFAATGVHEAGHVFSENKT